MVLSAIVVVALALCGDVDPAEAGSAPPSVSGAVHVAVLPISGADLSPDEVAVITRLIAIRVERMGLVVVENGGAGGAPAEIELSSEHAKLGEADVVTVEARDVAAHRTFRDATSAKERGDLADKLGPVVDSVLQRALASLPALERPDVRAHYDDARLAVCTEPRGWFFCDRTGRAITENDFVRRYRSETNRHDLDVAEFNRQPSFEPWIFLIVGGATGLATVAATIAIGSTPDGQAFARQSQDSWVVVPVLGLSAALGLVVYGAIELDDGRQMNDGTELDHVLDDNQGRAAAQSYNDALRGRVEREAGGAR